MTLYFDSRGQTVRTGHKLGSGGEGDVFEVEGRSDLVAKIYHRTVSPESAEKLRLMTSLASESLMRCAAVPVAVIGDRREGQVSGILMPRVRGHLEIHSLYSPAHRKTHFPDKDWSFLIHVATNIAAVFDTVHQHGLVIGDVNQGNILVSPRGTVVLIDCDSFQVNDAGRYYPCEVGVAHFTPPELQGRSFQGLQRTVNHDLFGLAILIFHLLCMGRHPYAGRFVGQGDPPPIEKAIEEHRYAYSTSEKTLLVPPPQTLLLPAVMPGVAGLFERAFLKGSERSESRPDEGEWYRALRDLKSQLKPCAADIGHKYPNYLGTCPWCSLEREGAPNFFASVTAHLVGRREGELSADIHHLWQPIVEIRQHAKECVIEKVSFAKLPIQHNPIPERIVQNQAFSQLLGWVWLGATGLLLTTWWNPFLLMTSSAMVAGFGIWRLVLIWFYGLGTEISRRERKLKEAINRMLSLEQEATRELDSVRVALDREFSQLELTVAAVEGLQKRYQADLDAFNLQMERRQLEAFLQSHLIRQARIPLISDWQKSTLESFGIETAFDLNEVRLANIMGFGSLAISALMDWKKHIQDQFRFKPREKIPAVERNTILAKYLRQREGFEEDLISGRDSFELLLNQLKEVKSRYQIRLEMAARDAKQAEADALQVGGC